MLSSKISVSQSNCGLYLLYLTLTLLGYVFLVCSLITGSFRDPAFAARLTVFNRHPLLNNPVTCLGIDRVGQVKHSTPL